MSKTFIPQALRRAVKNRAVYRCEYCRVPDAMALLPHHIDHVIPEKQGGATDAANLAYCCQPCNISKGASVAAYSQEWQTLTPLYHPREQAWVDHFRLLPSGRIEALSVIGEATLRILKINRLDRIARRRVLVEQGLV